MDDPSSVVSQNLRLAMRSREEAEDLAEHVRGKQSYQRSESTTLSCPAPAVMTARIEPSSPETTTAGYPYTLIIGCRIPDPEPHDMERKS